MFKALLYLLVLVIFMGCNKEFNIQTKLHKLSVESQKET